MPSSRLCVNRCLQWFVFDLFTHTNDETHHLLRHTQQYDAIQLKKELEKVQADNKEKRAEYKRQLEKVQTECERAQKRQRKLEKEKEELKKKVQAADADNFAAYCTESPAVTPHMTPLMTAMAVPGSAAMTAVDSPRRGRSNSMSVSKPKSTLSQFII